MKWVVLLSAICVVFLVSAGCVSEPAVDPLVGSWVAYNHTSASGLHSVQLTDTYYENHSGTETLILDDGTIFSWSLMWLPNGTSYDLYYQPITMELKQGNTVAVLNSGTEIKSVMYEHVSGSGVLGEWKLTGSYVYDGMEISDSVLIVNEDGSSHLESSVAGEPYMDTMMQWVGIGTGMYVHSPSKPIVMYISEDGKLHDTLNLTYTRL